MSKFLTPPVWYDENENLVEILTGSIGTSPGAGITNSMAIGKGSVVAGSNSVAIGTSALNYGGDAIAIGYYAQTPAPGSIAIGLEAVAAPDDSYKGSENIVIGNNSQVIGDRSIAIGSGITLGTGENPVSYTIQIGAPDKPYTFKVGNRDVFGAIDAAAGTFFIGTTKYKATYNSGSATLNFVPATT